MDAHATSVRPQAAAREVLTFRMCGQEYGVDILKVQEIRSYGAVTRIPDVADFVMGLLNLRGVIVPVVDLRLRFRLAGAAHEADAVMIVLNIGSRTIAAVVDGVSDVVALAPTQVLPPPDLATVDSRSLAGLGVVDQRMLILLDVDTLFADSPHAALAAAA
ncbi:MAG: chemotaxis protein CheW [Nevskia sp.]|nr:chemotaxis protein CheW [Nevskia sp.]